MRFAPTRSEERLWRQLAGGRTGVSFRRQLVIGPFIVDFACTKLRLVVEVDGDAHRGRERHDAARDRTLSSLGWSVLRVSEELVLNDVNEAVRRIVASAHLRDPLVS